MFDFDTAVTAPFRMQPGLRRLDARARQLTPLAPGSRHQREKLAVLSALWPQALLQRPGFDATPALAALAAHAATEHPDAWCLEGRRMEARCLGTALDGDEVVQTAPGRFGLGDEVARCLRGLPPGWRRAGLLSLAFEEDFAILDTGPGPHHGTVPWLAVALPSHWAPEDKIGLSFVDLHAAVADNALLLQAGASLVRLVSGPQRWERFVWNVTDQPRLHAHPARVDEQRWQHTTVERAWFRTERQTFLPLPVLQQVVFTIQVAVDPLAAVVSVPARAATLHAAIASMTPAVLAYRGLAAVRDTLLSWLEARAAGPSSTTRP